MIRYLTLAEVIELDSQILEQSSGSSGIRDMGALESAIAQPRMSFGGAELYPTAIEKASALGFSIVINHPFVDGNKRVGHAAMEIFLVLNRFEIKAVVDEQERAILALAASGLDRDAFTN
jgi:death on curing protein